MHFVFIFLSSLIFSSAVAAADSVTLKSETGDTLMIHQFKMVNYGAALC